MSSELRLSIAQVHCEPFLGARPDHAQGEGNSAAQEASRIDKTWREPDFEPAPQVTDQAIQTRLDEARERFRGHYGVIVNGVSQEVNAFPAYRISTSKNPSSEQARAKLDAALPPLRSPPASSEEMSERAAVRAQLGMVVTGKAPPEQIQRVTRALIEVGALAPFFTHAAGNDTRQVSPEEAIRRMQKQYGIGVDCSGFCFWATREVQGLGGKSARKGELGLESSLNENFDNVAARAQLDRKNGTSNSPVVAVTAGAVIGTSGTPEHDQLNADLAKVRPGDLVVCASTNKAGKPVIGHKVIVYDTRSVEAGSTIRCPDGSVLSLLVSTAKEPHGPYRVLTVDSSWGGNSGGPDRKLLIYDEATGKWHRTVQSKDESGNSVTALSSPKDQPYPGGFRGIVRLREPEPALEAAVFASPPGWVRG